MRFGIYCIYDAKVSVFMRPWLARSEPEATRTFGDAVRGPDSDIGRHPEDYFLYHIGFYDDESAAIEPIRVANILSATACVAPDIRSIKEA